MSLKYEPVSEPQLKLFDWLFSDDDETQEIDLPAQWLWDMIDEFVYQVPEMCSGSEEGSYLRLIDFVSLNSGLESNIEEEED